LFQATQPWFVGAIHPNTSAKEIPPVDAGDAKGLKNMNDKCKGKLPFATQAEAQSECVRLKRRAKRTGEGGRSFKRLHVYVCGNHFHIGRDNSEWLQKMPEIVHNKPAKKIPSQGQLLRRLRNIEKRMDAERRHWAYTLGQLIAADARRDYEQACAAIGITPEKEG
jgi:hypothetical protein